MVLTSPRETEADDEAAAAAVVAVDDADDDSANEVVAGNKDGDALGTRAEEEEEA